VDLGAGGFEARAAGLVNVSAGRSIQRQEESPGIDPQGEFALCAGEQGMLRQGREFLLQLSWIDFAVGGGVFGGLLAGWKHAHGPGTFGSDFFQERENIPVREKYDEVVSVSETAKRIWEGASVHQGRNGSPSGPTFSAGPPLCGNAPLQKRLAESHSARPGDGASHLELGSATASRPYQFGTNGDAERTMGAAAPDAGLPP
jgi:hypothetical protein